MGPLPRQRYDPAQWPILTMDGRMRSDGMGELGRK